jgi:ABC transport system ATP-binding/permease protein
LPLLIEKLEAEISKLQQAMSSPDFFKNDPATVTSTTAKLAETEKALEATFNRWSELEP